MESPNRLLLLASVLATLALSGCALFRGDRELEQQQSEAQAAAEEAAEDADSTPPRVIEPNVARRKIKTPRIDNENWELGVGAGFLSIEDFGTNSTYAAQLSYHVTEDFFFRADLGQSTAGRTSFETLGGDIELMLNRRALIGAFPWRYEGLEGCPCRIVAFLDAGDDVQAVGNAAKAILGT